MKRQVTFAAIALGLAMTHMLAGPTAHADQIPGCKISPPDAHVIAGRKIDVDFLFRCNNPRIRYVKVTLNIKRHRGGLPDATVESYQFDDFRNPSRAAVNAPLQTDGPCEKGKRYHGDITVNISLNANQQHTETVRGRSVTCR